MFKKIFVREREFPYLDSPAGILIPKGYLFSTREKQLKAYAGALLETAPAGEWLRKATRWIESTDAVGVWVSLLMLALLPLVWAVPAAFAATLLWHRSRSALAGPALDAPLKVLSNEVILFLAAVAALSWFGMSGAGSSVLAGLVLFMACKFGWIRMLLSRLFDGDAFGNANTAAEKPAAGANDRILNMLLVRFALREGITLASVETMERDMLRAMEKSAEQRSFRKSRMKK